MRSILKIEANPDLLSSIKRRSLLQSGLDLVDGPHCPLCDTDWDIGALRAHLQEKLEKSKEAQVVRDKLLEAGRSISKEVIRIRGLIEPLTKIAEVDKKFVKRLGQWSGNLLAFSEALSSLEGTIALKERLESGWASIPDTLSSDLDLTREKVKARPDKSATVEAHDFLVVAQERLNNWRLFRRDAETKNAAASRGKIAYKVYCDVAEAALVELYAEVEGDFGNTINSSTMMMRGSSRLSLNLWTGSLGSWWTSIRKACSRPAHITAKAIRTEWGCASTSP
ncbi:MAG TPA: hypothetical protein VJ124_18635 [Pyrinomonadaceae bacterium]|nr:hypothetical protein [Pyrinomonadaceae bacterium]